MDYIFMAWNIVLIVSLVALVCSGNMNRSSLYLNTTYETAELWANKDNASKYFLLLPV